MKKATKLTAAALATTLSLSLAACGSSASTGTASTSASADGVVYRTLDEIKADGTINIGVFSDKNPFGYVDENDEYQGYDIYFANRLAEDLGVKGDGIADDTAAFYAAAAEAVKQGQQGSMKRIGDEESGYKVIDADQDSLTEVGDESDRDSIKKVGKSEKQLM